jgi:soluble lytic murein transglycosylase
VPDAARDPIALDARRLLAGTSDPSSDACTALADRLMDDGRLDAWPRLQALLERYQFPAVRRLAAARLPAAQAAQLQHALDRPERWLADNADTFPPEQRGIALLALVVLSREQADVAAQWMERIEGRFDESQRAAAWGRIAHMGQLSHLDPAVTWFGRAGALMARGPDYVRAPEVLESQARAQIARAASAGCARQPLPAGEVRDRWTGLSDAIERLAPDRRSDPTWTYWHGCARMALGQPEDARSLWKSIADRPGFHGRLAAEELGQPLLLPPAPDAPREEDIARLAPLPAFERARHFLALGLREEGNREWSAGLRGLDDRGLLAAAELASRMGLVDRMIASSESTRGLIDIGSRFPAPYRDRMAAITAPLQLEPSWVYGLIRQESRFIEGVHSSAGAVGLMQLMPATASYVAHRIGLPQAGSAAQRLGDTEVNLRLGS